MLFERSAPVSTGASPGEGAASVTVALLVSPVEARVVAIVQVPGASPRVNVCRMASPPGCRYVLGVRVPLGALSDRNITDELRYDLTQSESPGAKTGEPTLAGTILRGPNPMPIGGDEESDTGCARAAAGTTRSPSARRRAILVPTANPPGDPCDYDTRG